MPARNPLIAAASALASALGASLNGGAPEANTVPVPRLAATGARRLGPTVRVVADGRAPYRRPRPAGVRAAFDSLPRRERRWLERAAAGARTPHLAATFRSMVEAALYEHRARTGEAAHA